jgi:small-conductance mechanosensitive channel
MRARHAVPAIALVLSAGLALAERAAAQAPADPLAPTMTAAARGAHVSDAPARLRFANREIVVFRATVLSRPPAARAEAVAALLDRVVADSPAGRVNTRAYPEGVVVRIGDAPVFVVMALDVDALAGEDLTTKASQAAAALQVAFDEAVELRTPSRLAPAVAIAVAATAVYLLLLWLLVQLHRAASARVTGIAERRLRTLPGGEVIVGAAHAPAYVRRSIILLSALFGVLLTYSWLTIVLRRFPYTRPWGESLRGGLVAFALSAGRAVLDQLPNLATVLVIVILTRFAIRLTGLLFRAVEEERITLPGIYPETAAPTRRLAVALLWLFALIVSYNYLPGSNTEVFKGVSVFLGLVVSLGSTGIMNQLMSGLMVTYSRALRVGDFVRVGEVEGTVTQLGTLSTKIRTPRNEEITVPNAVVVAQATTNFSRYAADGVMWATSVTIGYDTPWRQVHALLEMAAERTAGVRAAPKPAVLQTSLSDFYVQYTLLVSGEQANRKLVILNALHANIQDLFNEYGVQIMSPNYEADPEGAKVVPQNRWYAAPARPPAAPAGGDPAQEASIGGVVR